MTLVPAIVVTFLVMLLAAAAMAIGVMISGKRLRGSCGGTQKDCECLRLGRTPPEDCDRGDPAKNPGHPSLVVHPPNDQS